MADKPLNLTHPQSSDVDATDGDIAHQLEELEVGNPSLGRDLIALLLFFLVIVTYHVQNPLLLFEVKFGTAFRNESLQPVLALGVLFYGFLLVRDDLRPLTKDRLKLAAIVGLALWTLHVIVAIVFRYNIFATIFGVDQALLFESLEDDAPREAMRSMLVASSVLYGVALIGIVYLLAPWGRLPVYVDAAQRYAAPLIVGALVIILWEVLIIVFNVQEFLLPRPSVIIAKFVDIYPRLVTVAWNTFKNAFWGFVWGCSLGIFTGIISARFTSFSKALLPLAIAANSVPIIATAPIFNIWFGALNPASKIGIVAILTYFPSTISTIRGLTSVDRTALELMESYAASQWAIFTKLRIPTALPYIFSALKVSTTLAMIGAIVSEYFGGSTQGLGYRIREDSLLFNYPEAWSAILIASALGIAFYMFVSAAERTVMPWHVSFRDD